MIKTIPESIFAMTVENYGDFLEQRRKLMAEKMKNYYYSLRVTKCLNFGLKRMKEMELTGQNIFSSMRIDL